MPKFSAKVIVNYDGVLGTELGESMTKAKTNELMRDVVGLQIGDALRQYGFSVQVSEIRKVNSRG